MRKGRYPRIASFSMHFFIKYAETRQTADNKTEVQILREDMNRRRFMSDMYGYVRVSAKDPCEDRQLLAMREFGVAENSIFLDKLSGKDFQRPQYKRLMRRLEKGDVLVVKSIDRLGRNYGEIRVSAFVGAVSKGGRYRQGSRPGTGGGSQHIFEMGPVK